jgi:hypothetical protein
MERGLISLANRYFCCCFSRDLSSAIPFLGLSYFAFVCPLRIYYSDCVAISHGPPPHIAWICSALERIGSTDQAKIDSISRFAISISIHEV